MTIRGGTGSSDGNVGIGTSSPAEKLTVSGSISTCGSILTPTVSAARNTYFANCVGIGTTNSYHPLTVEDGDISPL